AQPLRAAEDGLLMLELAGAEGAVDLPAEQPAVADDRGERRAQLVTHHGQELRLELVQAAQLLVHLSQRPRLTILLGVLRLVLPHEAGRFDKDLVTAAQDQERERRRRAEPVDDDDDGGAAFGGRPRRRQDADRSPQAYGHEDERKDDPERLDTL